MTLISTIYTFDGTQMGNVLVSVSVSYQTHHREEGGICRDSSKVDQRASDARSKYASDLIAVARHSTNVQQANHDNVGGT